MQELYPLIESYINYTLFKGNIINKARYHNYGLNHALNLTVLSVDLPVYSCLLQLSKDNFLTHCKHTIKIKPKIDQCFHIKYLIAALT